MDLILIKRAMTNVALYGLVSGIIPIWWQAYHRCGKTPNTTSLQCLYSFNEVMANQTKYHTAQKTYWRSILIDFVWVPIAFLSAYIVSSHFNFSDNYYIWARQYEQSIDIDELLPTLLASLIAMLWFAKRRINESRILIKRNHALLQRILEVQEDERKRIARDLHDDLGQYLSAIKAQASSLLVDANITADAKVSAKSITSSANHAYQATHDLIRSLRPVALDELGLSASLEHLVDTWRSINTGALIVNPEVKQVNYLLNIKGNIDVLSESINIAIFRIVQEALTNCAKHAQANTINVSIVNYQQELIIIIDDDGIGFDTTRSTIGFGLLGIQERVESLNGDLQIFSQHKSGVKIMITIKVN